MALLPSGGAAGQCTSAHEPTGLSRAYCADAEDRKVVSKSEVGNHILKRFDLAQLYDGTTDE